MEVKTQVFNLNQMVRSVVFMKHHRVSSLKIVRIEFPVNPFHVVVDEVDERQIFYLETHHETPGLAHESIHCAAG